MSQYNFGAGSLIGTPLTDGSGNAIAVPSPIIFGALQDVSIDLSADVKQLFGQNQYPLAVGRGKAKISGKAKFAQINGATFNSLFFGQTMAAGILADVIDTTGAAIPGTPYSITPTPPSSGTWAFDLGVRDQNGLPMTRVATGATPTTGQYKVSAGAYTFAAADTTKTVFISYQYTATSTSGPQKSTVMNVAMGYAPTFQADLFNSYNGKTLTITLYSCVATKLSIATKLDDFLVPEFDFEAFANAAGQVMTWGTSE